MFEENNIDISQSIIKYAKKETSLFLDYITTNNEFKTVHQNTLKTIQSSENIPYCEEHEGFMYNFYQDNDYPKGVYRFCKSIYYRIGIPKWEIIFDVSDFDKILNDNVFLKSIQHYILQPERILLFLSSNGRDEHYTLEFDIKEKKIITNGFNFPLGKNYVNWQDINHVFLSPAWDKNLQNKHGFAKQIYLLSREENFENGEELLQINDNDLGIQGFRYLDPHGKYLDLIIEYHNLYAKTHYYLDSKKSIKKLKLPKKIDIYGYLGGYLVIHLKENYINNKKTYKKNSILAIKLNKGMLHKIQILFEVKKNQAIENIEISKNYILIHYLDTIHSKLYLWHYQDNNFLPREAPNFNVVNLEITNQPWSSDIFYIITEDLLNAPILYSFDAGLNELSVIRKQKPIFNTKNLVLKQFFAISKDKTKIPYFWCGPKKVDANTPALVYVYGGFKINLLPYYMPNIGKSWLGKNYSFVIANIRGGGELGENWHGMAIKQNKGKSVEDLIAIIDDMHHKKLSSPLKTAIQGGSNGGFIVANTICKSPNILGAAICENAIIDIQNIHNISNEQSLIEEYGNPRDKKNTYLNNINPLKLFDSSKKYPPFLITCNLNDDRVHPSHSLKLYDLFKSHKKNVWLYVNDIGGHENELSQEQNAFNFALIILFLYKNICK